MQTSPAFCAESSNGAVLVIALTLKRRDRESVKSRLFNLVPSVAVPNQAMIVWQRVIHEVAKVTASFNASTARLPLKEENLPAAK